jgi:hypothetical protein
MGTEALCRVEYGGDAAEAKVLLETDELIIRGGMKLRIPFREMEQVAAEDGALTFHWKGADVRISIGMQAAKWADKIRNPRSVIDKIGVKSGQRISIVGDLDDDLSAAIAARSGDVTHTARKGSDIIFFAVSKREELPRLEKLRQSLAPAGALWIIRPKGTGAIKDGDVIAAGRKAGLVDVKVVRVSEALSGEKLVIPVTKR